MIATRFLKNLTIPAEKRLKPVLQNRGFTLLEAVFAISILSFGFVALFSASMSLMNGNKISKRFLEASVLGQSTLESFKYTGFKVDSSGAISAVLTPAGHPLSNPSSSNDSYTDPSQLFKFADHAYSLSTKGAEILPILDNPASLAPTKDMRRAWVVRDNVPAPGMKTITVIVAWKERLFNQYFTITTALQGQ